MNYSVAIIGAGASGMLCASMLNSHETIIIENNSTIAKKVAISGGGKCNVTNQYMDASHFLGDEKFIQSTLNKFSNTQLLQLLKDEGINSKLNPKIVKGTYFLDHSKHLINFFQKKSQKCKLLLNTKVSSVSQEDGGFCIATNKGLIKAKNLIVASGGCSYANIGATPMGFEIAQYFGHPLVLPTPALVGLTVQKEEFWFKKLSGVSLDVVISVGAKKLAGSLLFTHKGISGPAVLSASLYWQKGKMSIDFMPKGNIKSMLQSNQKLSNLITPKRFAKEFLNVLGIEDKACSALDAKEIEKLQRLHHYEFAPAGNFGFLKAEVTKGGVDTNFVDENMQSKLIRSLYFVGEVLDVTGELGGYNIQWALSSAHACAIALGQKL